MTAAADARAATALANRFRDAAGLLDAVAMMGSAGLEVKSATRRPRKASNGDPAATSNGSTAPAGPSNHDRAPPATSRVGDVAVPPATRGKAGGPVESNQQAAGRPSRKEIRGAIRAAIMAHPRLNDAEIAARVGCHKVTVAKQRAEIESGAAMKDGGGGDGDGDGDDAEPAEKSKPPPTGVRKLNPARLRAIRREARSAIKSGQLTREVLEDGQPGPLATALFGLPIDELGRIAGADEMMTRAIYARAEKLRERWSDGHERKANNYFLPPLEYEPVENKYLPIGFGAE